MSAFLTLAYCAVLFLLVNFRVVRLGKSGAASICIPIRVELSPLLPG